MPIPPHSTHASTPPSSTALCRKPASSPPCAATAQAQAYLRFSPHFYNTESELETVAEVFAQDYVLVDDLQPAGSPASRQDGEQCVVVTNDEGSRMAKFDMSPQCPNSDGSLLA
jgi:hypothetical protein